MLYKVSIFAVCIMLFGSVSAKKLVIKGGDKVSVEYTGKLLDGTVFDTNVGKQGLEFVVGEGMLLPDFENAVLGMKQNESKTIKIPAVRAYGEYSKDQIITAPIDKLPVGTKEGDELTLKTAQGNFAVKVLSIKEVENIAFIDGNHKLAGKDLTFDLTIKSIIKTK
jgi:FKBP-type peptidyl-prolyl cis-trans isomerase 2